MDKPKVSWDDTTCKLIHKIILNKIKIAMAVT